MKRPRPIAQPDPRASTAPRVLLVATLIAAGALAACSSRPLTLTEGPAYPEAKLQGPTLDIQVVRKSTKITLTNTTARSYGPLTMWLNARFSKRLDGLAIGQTITLRLADFQDQWGDRFRAGGFFATEKSERLAKAEVELDEGGPLLGLVVIGGEE